MVITMVMEGALNTVGFIVVVSVVQVLVAVLMAIVIYLLYASNAVALAYYLAIVAFVSNFDFSETTDNLPDEHSTGDDVFIHMVHIMLHFTWLYVVSAVFATTDWFRGLVLLVKVRLTYSKNLTNDNMVDVDLFDEVRYDTFKGYNVTYHHLAVFVDYLVTSGGTDSDDCLDYRVV